MGNILLANIGNRNISFQGKTYNSQLHGLSFRDWTQGLLARYDDLAPDLTENILTRLFDPANGQPGVLVSEISKLVLFATNQVTESKQDQDTLHEAALIKRLFEQQYGFPVEIQELQCKVTDNDALLHQFRNKLSNLLRNNPDTHFVICDAGGTAQLKFNLKIIAEYLLPVDRFEVLYVNINGPVETVPQKEYRRVIDDEQIRSLLKAGQYRAALLLRGFERPADVLSVKSAAADKLLLFGYARFNRTDDLIQRVAQAFGKNITQFPDVSMVSQWQTPPQTSRFIHLMNEKTHFALVELLLKTRYLFRQRRYNETILTFAVFYETYLATIITHQFGYDLLGNYKQEKERLRRDWPTFFPGETADRNLDVPMQIDLCLRDTDENNQTFLLYLNPYVDRGSKAPIKGRAINEVRNKVAHNGLYVSDEMMRTNLAYLPDLLEKTEQLFDLATADPYEELNQHIIQSL